MEQQFLQERFEYKEGRLYYREKIRGHRAGEPAGFLAKDTGIQRRHITIKKKRMIHARVVWVYHHGDIPTDKTIDHINRIATDDRIENLRLASKREQQLNTDRTLEEQSGVEGVLWNKRRKRWCVWTKVDGKKKWVGSSKVLNEAISMKEAFA